MRLKIEKEILVGEICKFLDSQRIRYDFYGDSRAIVRTYSNWEELEDHSICLVRWKRDANEELINKFHVLKEVLVVSSCRFEGVNCIVTDDAKVAFFFILNHFFAAPFPHTISKQATVLTDAIGENVHIAPGCFVGENVSIGDNTILHPNVVIECPCEIGKNCEIFSGVSIGGDGFGYDKDSGGAPHRETHGGGVVIGDNVDIGANSSIDRGLLTDVIIEDNVKIASLCHIGHDAHIEKNCLIVNGTVVCGSAHIKRDNYLAPGSLINNLVTIGERAKIGIGSVAMWDVEPDATIFGNPGQKIWSKKWSTNWRDEF